MIHQISLENFFSLREEAIVDFEPTKIRGSYGQSGTANVMQDGNIPLLKSVAIFGANASGKSNFLKGFEICVNMICASESFTDATSTGYEPFKFGDKDTPGKFEIELTVDGTRYSYGFKIAGNKVVEEHLFNYPKKYKSLVFSRETDENGKEHYKFSKNFVRPKEVMVNTSPVNLFLSRSAQMNRDISAKVVKFFRDRVVFGLPGFEPGAWRDILTGNREQILEALSCADSDICDYEVMNVSEDASIYKLITYHSFNRNVPFLFDTEESAGTRRLLAVIMAFIDVAPKGKVLVIDELESSLHTQLVTYVVNLFNSSNGSQLIFSTHDTDLLDTGLLRPDQIYFTSKDHRTGGQTYTRLRTFPTTKITTI